MGIPYTNPVKGRSEEELAKVFYESDYRKKSQPSSLFPLTADVDLPFRTDHKDVLIELDSTYHFNYSPNTDENGDCLIVGFNGGTILKSALQATLATTAVILRMPFTVVDAIFDSLDPTIEASAIMENADNLKSGAYYLDFDDDGEIELYPMFDAGLQAKREGFDIDVQGVQDPYAMDGEGWPQEAMTAVIGAGHAQVAPDILVRIQQLIQLDKLPQMIEDDPDYKHIVVSHANGAGGLQVELRASRLHFMMSGAPLIRLILLFVKPIRIMIGCWERIRIMSSFLVIYVARKIMVLRVRTKAVFCARMI